MRFSNSFVITSLSLLPALSLALLAVSSGPCASICGNVSSTTKSEISCSDSDISNTDAGQKFQSCITCQLNSTAVDPGTGETDLHWMLFNLRYAMSSCIWGYNNFSSGTAGGPCVTEPACGTFEDGVEFDDLTPTADTYAYCGSFQSSLEPKCSSCLQQLGTEFYLSNFFSALLAGCSQKPASGVLLGLQGSLFSTTPVNATNPTKPGSNPGSPANKSGPLSIGAEVAIAVSGVVVLLGLIGTCIVCRGKRVRAAKLELQNRKRTSYKDYGAQPSALITSPPTPGWTSAGTDESPVTAGGYGSEKFSPYTSQYNSPVSARDQIDPNSMWDRHDRSMRALVGNHEALEMEKLRDKRIEDRKTQQALKTNEFLNDAARRGFTTSPASPASMKFPPPPPPSKGRARGLF